MANDNPELPLEASLAQIGDVFVGRQAIYDRDLNVYGYELLFRHGITSEARVFDGDQATSRVLLNAIFEFGLDRLVGPRMAFVNLTRRFLLDGPAPEDSPLRNRLVLEALEGAPVDPALIEGVAQLAHAGWTVALDDYSFDPKWDPLLPHVRIVKCNVPSLDLERLDDQLGKLRDSSVKLLAEKIETQAEFDRLKSLGFDYFQGYFLARPNLLQRRRVAQNQLVLLRLLARLSDPAVELGEIEEIISHDTGLSYRVLRAINSAAVGLPNRVNSIREAVVFIGLNQIRFWATLLTLSMLSDKPRELMVLALVRASYCRAILRELKQPSADAGFTAGLLSILDALLDLPIADAVSDLPLAEEVTAAIVSHQGPIGEVLRCARAYEEWRWTGTCVPGVDPKRLQAIYLESLAWALEVALDE